jgi:hypothetical protein
VSERAPAVGAAGADASLAQQRAERAGGARAMLGKKGTPSLFKFGFKVVGHASECALRRVGGFLSSGWRSATPTNVGGGMHQGVRCAGLLAS